MYTSLGENGNIISVRVHCWHGIIKLGLELEFY